MKDIYLKRIATNDDIVTVREIFPSIFPGEKHHEEDCIEAFADSIIAKEIDHQLDYYFAYDRSTNELVGVTGVYAKDTQTAWLGWFGILPKFQRHGYGRTLLRKTLDLMRTLGYIYVRLYTEPSDMKSGSLYLSEGFIIDSKYDDMNITMKMALYPGVEPPANWEGRPYGM